jgi:hypothetical protein
LAVAGPRLHHIEGITMLTAPVLALLLAAAPGDAYTLKWKLAAGDVFYNKTTMTTEQTIEVMNQKIDQTIKMNMVMKFSVKSAKAGATVVEMTYLDMKVDAAGLPGANIADKLKGVSFTATLNDKMEVTKLEGYNKLLDAVGGDDENLKKMLKLMMPESTIRQTFGQTFVVAPDKPIAVGDKWDRTDKYGLGPLGNVEAKQAFKLDAVKNDVATISVKGDLTYKAADGDDGGLPFKIVKADLKADKFAATHTFDIKTGRVTETKVDMDISGSMTIGIAGMEVEAKLVQKVKTVGVLTEKNPVVD